MTGNDSDKGEGAARKILAENLYMAKKRFSDAELDALFGAGPAPAAVKTAPKPPQAPALEERKKIEQPRPEPSQEATPLAAQPEKSLKQSELSPDGQKVLEIPVNEIQKNPHQPRLDFDERKLEELAESIRARGVLQPILVRKTSDGYQLVAGERRLRGSQKAGLETIPAMVVNLSEQELLEVALVENLQRDDLNAIEESRAYDFLSREFGMTHEVIAKRVGKDRTTVVNSLRLLRLPADIQSDIQGRRLSAGHARALLSLDNEEQMLRIRSEIHESGLSVRQTEERVRDLLQQKKTFKPKSRQKQESPAEIVDMEEKLMACLGYRVRLRPITARSGKIEISYNDLEELDAICRRLGMEESTL